MFEIVIWIRSCMHAHHSQEIFKSLLRLNMHTDPCTDKMKGGSGG